ncbi:hypothetical protein EW146_g6195 [Bondarzewia mesenterica]|uniref:A-kinase anchor protein 7-like phosphoesterase domain-containing protein n=1 Tax=Bondarzewia mesenterica TaxID=1095465 RepID=A0A4S4LP97_9AGAM|nr:hypothetical protein EW146_g6195 [Bondarzewia mesenterica]
MPSSILAHLPPTHGRTFALALLFVFPANIKIMPHRILLFTTHFPPSPGSFSPQLWPVVFELIKKMDTAGIEPDTSRKRDAINASVMTNAVECFAIRCHATSHKAVLQPCPLPLFLTRKPYLRIEVKSQWDKGAIIEEEEAGVLEANTIQLKRHRTLRKLKAVINPFHILTYRKAIIPILPAEVLLGSPTYFEGHHAELRTSLSSFTSALLAGTPSIPGLDASIVVPTRRLHLTLGVMSLDQGNISHTLDIAQSLLESLRPTVMDLLNGQRLKVGLERMDIMKAERGDASRAHVLFVGPSLDGEEGKRLNTVCEMVHKEFHRSGLIVDEGRPLKVVLNTTYRKPKPRGPRHPFSYTDILQSIAFRSISAVEDEGTDTESNTPPSLPLAASHATPEVINRREKGIMPTDVTLGLWDVDEIQICKMGSWGSEGEYVRVSGISLV